MLKPVEPSHSQAVEALAVDKGSPVRARRSRESLGSAPVQRFKDGTSPVAMASEYQSGVRRDSTLADSATDMCITNNVTDVTFLASGDTEVPTSTSGKRPSRVKSTSGVKDQKVQFVGSDDVNDKDYQDESQQDSDTNSIEEDADEDYVPLVSFVPLAYQIPQDVFQTVVQATPNTRASYYSTNLYRGPQGRAVSIHYCQTMEVADRVARYFLAEKVVGFDIEWKPWASPLSIKKNTSLIQLACENRVALFHIALFPGSKPEQLMPPNLKAVLESPNILKVGVAIKGDFSRLEKYLGIQPQGVFELSRLHNLVELHKTDPGKLSNKLVGLAAQVLQHLRLPLYKGTPLKDEPDVTSSVRSSDWSKPLDLKQILYAASDAYAGFRLHDVLEWKRKQLRPIPPPIQVCDYDAKPTPKPKVQRKCAKPARKSETTPGSSTEPISATQEQDLKDDEDSQDAEGYETASEEILDSHQLEDSTESPLSKVTGGPNDGNYTTPVTILDSQPQYDIENEEASSYRRVGKLNATWLPGPDPGYPILPQEPSETSTRPSTQQSNAASDEFDDPELEEALSNLELDSDGEIRGVENQDALKVDSTKETWFKKDPPSSPSPVLPLAAAPNSQYIDATNWAQTYLQSTIPPPVSKSPARIRATIPHLRAYHMWAHQKLSLDDIAKRLRDPPLAMSTVTGYIAQAISLEKLDYDQEALKGVVMTMPPSLRQGRWRRLSEQVEGLQ